MCALPRDRACVCVCVCVCSYRGAAGSCATRTIVVLNSVVSRPVGRSFVRWEVELEGRRRGLCSLCVPVPVCVKHRLGPFVQGGLLVVAVRTNDELASRCRCPQDGESRCICVVVCVARVQAWVDPDPDQ